MTVNQIQARKSLIEAAFIAAQNELMDQHKAGKFGRREYERAANKVNRWAEGQRNELAQILYRQI